MGLRSLPCLVANTYGLNFIQIGGIWIFWGGSRNPLLGGYMWPVMPIFELGWAIPVKSCVKIWFGLVEIWGMWIFSGGISPPLGGRLHVTCDAHLRTYPGYSSQKSCVKIWFGLVEPFKSYRVHKQHTTPPPPHPKKRQNHRRNWKQYHSENSFPGG